MIVSLVKGGLGNMMFQIAAGASLAKTICEDFAYSYANWHCCTEYKIDHYPTTVFSKINQIKSPNSETSVGIYQEPDLLYTPIPKIPNIILDGYFQSEKYFDIDLVKDLFDIPIEDQYRDYTFLHIRRGDYLKYSNVHPVMSDEYYKKGIELLNPEKVIILTDDREWAQTHELFSQFEISKSETDLEDLSIMRSCNSGIIANSTFSWWGAWLTGSDRIIAPSTWFANTTPINIIPNRWIKI